MQGSQGGVTCLGTPANPAASQGSLEMGQDRYWVGVKGQV